MVGAKCTPAKFMHSDHSLDTENLDMLCSHKLTTGARHITVHVLTFSKFIHSGSKSRRNSFKYLSTLQPILNNNIQNSMVSHCRSLNVKCKATINAKLQQHKKDKVSNLLNSAHSSSDSIFLQSKSACKLATYVNSQNSV